MKVIEGHFNPLKRPDRSVYWCRLTEKVRLDSDESVCVWGGGQTAEGWGGPTRAKKGSLGQGKM